MVRVKIKRKLSKVNCNRDNKKRKRKKWRKERRKVLTVGDERKYKGRREGGRKVKVAISLG